MSLNKKQRLERNRILVERHFKRHPTRRGWAQVNKRLKAAGRSTVSLQTYHRWLEWKRAWENEHGMRYSGPGRTFEAWRSRGSDL